MKIDQSRDAEVGSYIFASLEKALEWAVENYFTEIHFHKTFDGQDFYSLIA